MCYEWRISNFEFNEWYSNLRCWNLLLSNIEQWTKGHAGHKLNVSFVLRKIRIN